MIGLDLRSPQLRNVSVADERPLAAEKNCCNAEIGGFAPSTLSSPVWRLRPKAAVWGHGPDRPLLGGKRERRNQLGAGRSLGLHTQ